MCVQETAGGLWMAYRLRSVSRYQKKKRAPDGCYVYLRLGILLYIFRIFFIIAIAVDGNLFVHAASDKTQRETDTEHPIRIRSDEMAREFT